MLTLVRILADGLMIPLVLLAVWALLFKTPRASRYDRYVRVLMAGVTAYLLAKFIGSAWQPEDLRPFEQLGVSAGALYLNNPGFPSDHTLLASFLTLAVWYATKHRTLVLVLAGMTVAVAVGRVVALVHTPLDVVGGMVIASLGSIWYFEKFPVRLLAKSSKK